MGEHRIVCSSTRRQGRFLGIFSQEDADYFQGLLTSVTTMGIRRKKNTSGWSSGRRCLI